MTATEDARDNQDIDEEYLSSMRMNGYIANGLQPGHCLIRKSDGKTYVKVNNDEQRYDGITESTLVDVDTGQFRHCSHLFRHSLLVWKAKQEWQVGTLKYLRPIEAK